MLAGASLSCALIKHHTRQPVSEFNIMPGEKRHLPLAQSAQSLPQLVHTSVHMSLAVLNRRSLSSEVKDKLRKCLHHVIPEPATCG